ncbi:MAG: hypothetical protein IJP85_06315 [Synergistaceae bacterium]|nr:hypothetical protein [Synergistaceae bacterium]
MRKEAQKLVLIEKLITFYKSSVTEVRERTIAEVTAKIAAEVKEKAHVETARYLMGLGIMTDEQIAQAVQQTPEYVMSLRQELKAGNTH